MTPNILLHDLTLTDLARRIDVAREALRRQCEHLKELAHRLDCLEDTLRTLAERHGESWNHTRRPTHDT